MDYFFLSPIAFICWTCFIAALGAVVASGWYEFRYWSALADARRFRRGLFK